MRSEFSNEPIKFGIGDNRKSAALKIRVLRLQPGPRPATHVPRADALRHDALEAHGATVPKDGGTFSGDRLAELDAIAHRIASWPAAASLAASCVLPEAQGARPSVTSMMS